MAVSVPEKCRKTSQRSKCGQIYIWRAQSDDFISLTNASYHKPYTDDDRALRGRKIRVLVTEVSRR